MNDQALVRRMARRLRSKHSEIVEFELPRPTLQQVLDWIDYSRVPETETATQLTLRSKQARGEYIEPYLAERLALCRWMRRVVAKALALGFIDAATATRLTTPRNIPGDERMKLMRSVQQWRPDGWSRASNGAVVYTLLPLRGEVIYLTHEDGRWLRHEGYPYSVRG